LDIWTIILVAIFVVYFMLQVSYIVTSLVSKKASIHSANEQKISVLIPAYNEELVLLQCLESLKMVNYKNKEIIFINDGSTDNTMTVLHNYLELTEVDKALIDIPSPTTFKRLLTSDKYPNIYVIDQLNGGKSNALNSGISIATGEIIITLDADSILENDSLSWINEAFSDEKVVAAGGMVHVGQLINKRGPINYKRKMLLRYQLSGYLSSFYVRKVTQSKFNVLGVVSGAFGAFRRNVLVEIGGYRHTLGEDMEITFRLQKYINKRKLGEKLAFIPEAVCYTEVPENFSSLLHQRIRWQKGFVDCINIHKRNFFTDFSKKFSFFLLFESILLSIVGTSAILMLPIVIVMGHITPLMILLIASTWSSEFILRLVAVKKAGQYGYAFTMKCWIKIVLFTVWESLTFRLLDTFFFVYGTILYFVGSRNNWKKLKRSGSVIYQELDTVKKALA